MPPADIVKAMATLRKLLHSDVKRLRIYLEGLSCDPLRIISHVLTGRWTKGMTNNTQEFFKWFIDAKCKAPWIDEKDGGGWKRSELDFDVAKSTAEVMAKLAHKFLKSLVNGVDGLPSGFKALVTKDLSDEKDSESKESGGKRKVKS